MTMGSLMYVILYTRLDICFAIEMVSRYQSNSSMEHWTIIKHILKYFLRTRDYMLAYHYNELLPLRYTNSDFQLDRDFCNSTSIFVFTLGSRAVNWKSMKQSCIANFTMKFKYVTTFEVAKEVVWLRKFLMGLEVVPLVVLTLVLFFNNNGVVTQSKEPKKLPESKHIKRKYHFICEIVLRGVWLWKKSLMRKT